MEIDKAIKILRERLKTLSPSQPLDCYDAIQLGIEALIRIKETRTDYGVVLDMPLSGETT